MGRGGGGRGAAVQIETRPPRPRELQGGQARRVCQDEPGSRAWRLGGALRGPCGHRDSENKRFPGARLRTSSLLPPKSAPGRLIKSACLQGEVIAPRSHDPGGGGGARGQENYRLSVKRRGWAFRRVSVPLCVSVSLRLSEFTDFSTQGLQALVCIMLAKPSLSELKRVPIKKQGCRRVNMGG